MRVQDIRTYILVRASLCFVGHQGYYLLRASSDHVRHSDSCAYPELRMRSTYLVLNQSSEAWVSESKYLEFAVVGMAGSRELPAAFQVDCWDDDDECEEEGDDPASLKSRQREADDTSRCWGLA